MAKKPDWEAIESAYRAGLMSLREIASLHGITHGAINKRAKKEGWERNLKEKIKLKADALVSKREVSTQHAISERILIEANAEVIANVRMEHRGDIRRARELANHLFEELATKSANIDTFKKLGYLMVDPDDNGRDKRNEIYQVIISLPERVKAVKTLSETLKHLINLERQAYGIDDMQPHQGADQISQLMDELSQK